MAGQRGAHRWQQELRRGEQRIPGGWSIRVLRIVADGSEVVSEVEVPHDEFGVFRVASFWTIQKGRIVRGREYWTSVGADPRPEWRAALVEPM